MATAVAPPKTPTTSTSVDPLYTAAVNQAKQGYSAAAAPITAQQTASDAGYQSQEANATAEAAALSQLLQPIGPAVNNMYQTAAANQELAGGAFSAGMQDALKGNTDNLNAMLQKLNAPVQLDSHASQAGDVLYALGGYNPGVAFSKAGAAFGSAAELQAGDAILRGQDTKQDLINKATIADQGFQSKLAELAAKIPGDAQTNYLNLQKLSLDDAKFRETVQKDKIDAAYKQAQIKLQTAKYNSDVAFKGANLKLSAARINLDAQKFAQQTINQDRSYQLQLARIGLATKSLQLRAAAAEYKFQNGGFTPMQLSKFNGAADTVVTNAVTKFGNGLDAYTKASETMALQGIPPSVADKYLKQTFPHVYQPNPLVDAAYGATGLPSMNQLYSLPHNVAVKEIAAGARGRGLDPIAVLSIAAQEGLGGGVGDNGTSFGPFQLHASGALPAAVWAKGAVYAQKWSWSPAGINYALDQIAKVAKGLTGKAAITAISTLFERPANPANEIAGAANVYPSIAPKVAPTGVPSGAVMVNGKPMGYPK